MSKPDNETDKSALLQLHIAEYESLSTKMMYHMLFQAGVLPVVTGWLYLVYLVYTAFLLSPTWSSSNGLALWIGLIGLYLCGWIWSANLAEHYKVIEYIELTLKPSIANLFENTPPSFLDFERNMAEKNRATNIKLGNRVLPIVAMGVPLVLLICYRFNTIGHNLILDFGGTAVCLILILLVVLKVEKALKFHADAMKLPMKSDSAREPDQISVGTAPQLSVDDVQNTQTEHKIKN